MKAIPTKNPRSLGTVRSAAGILIALTVIGVASGWMAITNDAIAAQGEGDIVFRWAFGVLAGHETNPKLEAITADRALKTGDRLKMMVELEKECFVYVVYHGPQDQVKLLFPYTLSELASDYQVGKRYYIPQGAAWFELDQQVGSEAFHVVASKQRLTGLEAALSQYETSGQGEKPELANRVLAEIREVRKQSRDLATTAERPINIGGNVRGIDPPLGDQGPDVASLAQEVVAKGSYCRTFTIEHR
jgi:hypothetical protein